MNEAHFKNAVEILQACMEEAFNITFEQCSDIASELSFFGNETVQIDSVDKAA